MVLAIPTTTQPDVTAASPSPAGHIVRLEERGAGLDYIIALIRHVCHEEALAYAMEPHRVLVMRREHIDLQPQHGWQFPSDIEVDDATAIGTIIEQWLRQRIRTPHAGSATCYHGLADIILNAPLLKITP